MTAQQTATRLRRRWATQANHDDVRCLPVAETSRLLDKALCGEFAEPTSHMFGRVYRIAGHATVTPHLDISTGVIIGEAS